MRTQETVRYDLQSYIKLEILHKGSLCSENESIGGAMYDKKQTFFPPRSLMKQQAVYCIIKSDPLKPAVLAFPNLIRIFIFFITRLG